MTIGGFVFGLVWGSVPVQAQSHSELLSGGPPGGVITDRPDQTESSTTIPPGYVQTEIGYLFVEDRADNVTTTTQTFPFTLFRIGASNNLELRLGLEGVVFKNVQPGSETTAAGDGEIGIKYHAWGESGFIPDGAILAGTSVPWGGADLSSERFDPFLVGLFAHTINDWLSVGYNLGVVWGSEAEAGQMRDSFPSLRYTLSSSFGVTETVGMFLEFFGELPEDRLAQHSFDGGFTYMVNPSVQLDIEAGLGLNRAAEDWFIGTGIVVRLPQ